jgi:hypothetical protein
VAYSHHVMRDCLFRIGLSAQRTPGRPTSSMCLLSRTSTPAMSTPGRATSTLRESSSECWTAGCTSRTTHVVAPLSPAAHSLRHQPCCALPAAHPAAHLPWQPYTALATHIPHLPHPTPHNIPQPASSPPPPPPATCARRTPSGTVATAVTTSCGWPTTVAPATCRPRHLRPRPSSWSTLHTT